MYSPKSHCTYPKRVNPIIPADPLYANDSIIKTPRT